MHAKWEHLKELTLQLSDIDSKIPFGLLRGANCSRALETLQIVTSTVGHMPIALDLDGMLSDLSLHHQGQLDVTCDLCMTRTPVSSRDTYQVCNQAKGPISVKETTIGWLKEMYMTEFSENFIDKKGYAVEDKHFLDIMQNEVEKQDYHYVLPLHR